MLNEIVKSFLPQPKPKELSSEIEPQNILKTYDDEYMITGSFFDNNNGIYGNSEKSDLLKKQNEKIKKYRQISMQPEVSDALDEIVNEICFTDQLDIPVKLDFQIDSKAIKNKVQEEFDGILKMLNLKRNFHSTVKQTYGDGKIIFHTAYDKSNTKNGIQKITLIDPINFYFSQKDNLFKYDVMTDVYGQNRSVDYSPEEIVMEDFGLYSDGINLSYLEFAIKNANILRTMEDLLIPMRFSRSMSRRVFNVDIGDLPTKRGAEVMKEYQNNFKYKKFYNAETGEVSNQQHITSMVEDYWFANRSGGKGTQVDLLDETGNLGELDDILYFYKKLYKSLKIPTNRIPFSEENEFDYNDSRTTKEDIKFFMHVSRVRQVYSSIIKELLKRQIIAKGVMTIDDWKQYEDEIVVYFSNENMFIENMKLENFTKKLDIYATAQEYNGKLFSVKTVLQDIFKYSDEDIDELFKEIETEEKDPRFKKFYATDEDGGKW